ncbi:carbon-nitrogen hydrolase family protein [Marmoricola sp. RAF53]|uniref:carbon-nitrogen hydrolase family protein n=1 Tax=Marmoricola sp. RAF53 TaxID=3233059 RepID=UPI003F95B557
MGEQLRVAVWQHAASLDPAENRAALSALAPEVGGTDLLVLPEASARDFGEPGSALGPYAEPLDGPYAGALAALAADRGTAVLAGMFETSEDPERPFNTLVLAGPDGGRAATYRKIHLYDSFGQRESDLVTAGPLTPVVTRVADLSVGLMTCYDLRFPELARALSAAGADVLVLPAAWVAGPLKVDQWRTLVRARAIENLCWVVAAAQPGPRYSGHSMVVAPTGEVVAEASEGEELLRATLDLDAVREARQRNTSLGNRRL